MNNKNIKGVVIDAGHGGKDPGAIGNGIVEKELTLKISRYIHDRLNELGIPNKLVRESDITVDPTDRVDAVLSYYGNTPDVLVISNHVNAGGGDGAEVIYSLRNKEDFAKLITEEISKEGQNIRKYYQRRLPSNPSKDYYYIIRDTANAESVLIEYGFLDSSKDDVSQLKNNWQNLAEAVVRAIAIYIGVPYNQNINQYIVQKGDTLWGIGKKYNISAEELKKLNHLTSNTLSIGQKLILGYNNSDNETYVVQKGDTLYKIAKDNGLSVNELKQLNNLDSDVLSIGQKLLITKNEPNNKIYTVKSGDTLYSIAKNNNMTVDNLKLINNLSSNILSIGQQLIVN